MKFEKYELKSGKIKWKFFHYLGINPDTGKKDVIARQGFNSMAEARRELLGIIKEYEKGKAIKNSDQDNYRFGEVTELWLMQYKKQVKITTYTSTNNMLNIHILPKFKDYYLNRLKVRMCQDAVNEWYSSYSEAARLVSIVTRIFMFGINQGFCEENPMSKVIRPTNTHKKDKRIVYFEKDELLLFLNDIKQNEPLKAHTIFHVLAFTGLRRGELFGLQWGDIDFKRKTLSVQRNLIYNEEERQHEFSTLKTKSSRRIIGIDETTIKILLKWRNYQREFFLGRGININTPSQLVFTSVNNHYMSDTYLRRVIKRVTSRLELPRISVHGFRHTHCSLLFEAGVEMNSVKDRLGHSDIQTTMNIYAHVTKTERAKTADVFEDFMQENVF